jgi:membrane fusion protein (multidrug efflux system)
MRLRARHLITPTHRDRSLTLAVRYRAPTVREGFLNGTVSSMRWLSKAVTLGMFAATLHGQVETCRVVSRNVDRKFQLTGEFLPYQSVSIFARVNGYVEQVEVDVGSMVKKGQLLAVLSAPEMAAQSAEALSKVEAIEAQRAEAEAKLIAQQSTFERLKAASATPGAVAGNEIVLADKGVAAARALVTSIESSKRAAQAAADAIKELQSYLRITAPFDGVITDRLVHPGALVGPTSGAGPMLKLQQNSRLRLVVAVPEADVAGIARSGKVSFTVPAFRGETFYGTVARIPGSIDPKTRTMPVELDVLNARGRLTPGMYPEVSWPVKKSTISLLVPSTAVVTTTERTFVIRVKGGRAEWVNVKKGGSASDLVEVFGELSPDDQIVKRASDEIREGSIVRFNK